MGPPLALEHPFYEQQLREPFEVCQTSPESIRMGRKDGVVVEF